MNARECNCPHSFIACCCALGYTGESLLYHSRIASSVIGWPATAYDEAAVTEHLERMRQAKAERAAIEALNAGQEVAQAVRAAKPRIPLGVDQKTIPPADCLPCQGK